jgi:hypothetical protein
MATFIDRTALSTLGAIAYYLFFLNAWGSIPMACGAAFACALLSGRLLRGLPVMRRATAAQVRAELLRIAGLDDTAAVAALTALIEARWPGDHYRLAPVLKHPEATMSSGDVLNAWKANRDAERLVIAATCPCEPRAAFYARTLQSPVVAVVDSRGLTRLLHALPADALHHPQRLRPGQRLRALLTGLGAARFTPRSALLTLTMLGCYALTGSGWYLFPALVIAAHAGVSLIRNGSGRRLFDRN